MSDDLSILNTLFWWIVVTCTNSPTKAGPNSVHHSQGGDTAASLRRKHKTDMISTPLFLAIYSIGLLVTLAVLVPIIKRRKWNRLPIFILCIIFNILCIVSSAVRLARVYQKFDYSDPKQLKKFVALQETFVAIRSISYIFPVALILTLCILFIKVLVSIGLIGRKISYILYCIGSALILVTVMTNVAFIFFVLFAKKMSDVASYLYFSLMSLYIFLAGLFFGILALRVGVHALRLACSKKAPRKIILLFVCVFVLLVLRIPAYFVAMTGVLSRAHINFIISHISECLIAFVVCIMFHERIGRSFKSSKKPKTVQQQNSDKKKSIEKGEVDLESGKIVEIEEEEGEKEQKTIEEPQMEPVLAIVSVETENESSETK